MTKKLIFAVLLVASFNSAWAESCYPMTTPRMMFSNYLPLDSQPRDIETVIEFFCAPAFHGNQLHVRVSMQAGSQAVGYQLRNNVGDIIRVSFFIDPARSIPLTDDMSIPLYAVNFNAKTFSIVLYGRLPPNQRMAGAGQYRGFVNLQFSY